jgi:uncharacterized protein YqcC (DUF446 family)
MGSPNKPPDTQAILAKFDEVEREMKAAGLWDEGPEPQAKGNFMEMGFEAWLQWVFLPNARKAAEEGRLPEKSQVGPIALRQYDYHGHAPEADRLLRLLHAFDDLVNR